MLMKKAVKLSDVAARAEVSISTASLVLNGKGRISPGVARQVQEAAKSLGYVPRRSSGPSSRRRKRLVCVGVLVNLDFEWAHTWYMQDRIIRELDRTLRGRNVDTVLFAISSTSSAAEIHDRIRKQNVQAVYSIHHGDRELFEALEEEGIPVVVIMNSDLQNSFSTICVDDFQGAYDGARHLIGLGHRDILYVDYATDELPALAGDRHVGFRKACEENGIEVPPERRITCEMMDNTSLQERLGDVFCGARCPTAIFAMDDYIGARIYAILAGRNLRVPRDVSMICPGDVLDYSEPYFPRLTTMSIPFDLMGRFAAELLLGRREHRAGRSSVLKVTQQLVDRGSCISTRTRKQ